VEDTLHLLYTKVYIASASRCKTQNICFVIISQISLLHKFAALVNICEGLNCVNFEIMAVALLSA